MSSSRLIRSLHELESLLVSSSDDGLCAIDTEADSLHRYRESLCLVQFARGGESVLIDPIEIEDLAPLGSYLSATTVWMHGADYDMTMLKREFGSLPPVVYDTQIGARLLGERRFGLADLVERYFGVVLSKSSQKADWGKRPLSPKMIEYALNDVRYLLPMGDKIVAGLREKGRYEWFIESCEAARRKVIERDESREEPWRIQGAGRLDRKGLHFLKSLWEWRDAEASAWDRPSFLVVPNRQLIEWSLTLAGGKSTVGEGALLLLIYSLGLGVPFIVAALFSGAFMRWMSGFRAHLGRVEKVIGGLLVAAGVLFITGGVRTASYWLLETFPFFQQIG